jgi:hypothetical protein
MTDPSYMSDTIGSSQYSNILKNIKKNVNEEINGDQLRNMYSEMKPFINMPPTPFQNEERTYLKASEHDNESTAPKFSDKQSESFYEMLNRLESETQKEINNLEPRRRPDKREPVRIPFEDDFSVSSLGSYQSDPLNPFPNKIYNKMMGYF